MRHSEVAAVLVFLIAIAAVYLIELGLLVRHVRRRRRHPPEPTGILSNKALVVHALALTGLLCLLDAYFVEPYWVEVTCVTVRTDKLKHTSLRVVQISDTHCDPRPGNEAKLAGLINPLDADVIVFTGDALNADEAHVRFQQVMSSLHARLGKFAVRGNRDDTHVGMTPLFAGTGFQNLVADSVTLNKDGETFRVIGLSAFERARVREVLVTDTPPPFTIFLHHYASLIELVHGLGVDLYLAGHTHGGQVRLPLYGALVTLSRHGKKYEAGRYEVNGTTLYVNRGLGVEGFPFPRLRFLCRPEITVIDVVPSGPTSAPPP